MKKARIKVCTKLTETVKREKETEREHRSDTLSCLDTNSEKRKTIFSPSFE